MVNRKRGRGNRWKEVREIRKKKTRKEMGAHKKGQGKEEV